MAAKSRPAAEPVFGLGAGTQIKGRECDMWCLWMAVLSENMILISMWLIKTVFNFFQWIALNLKGWMIFKWYLNSSPFAVKWGDERGCWRKFCSVTLHKSNWNLDFKFLGINLHHVSNVSVIYKWRFVGLYIFNRHLAILLLTMTKWLNLQGPITASPTRPVSILVWCPFSFSNRGLLALHHGCHLNGSMTPTKIWHQLKLRQIKMEGHLSS